MDEMDDAHRRRVSELAARMDSIGMKREALLREILSPLTSQDRREEAFAQRVKLAAEWSELEDELLLLAVRRAS